ncbi:MAG: protease complex subunit PrcB family protein [bacterium]
MKIITILLALVMSCGGTKFQNSSEINFEIIAQHEIGGDYEASHKAIMSTEEFNKVFADKEFSNSITSVDFNNQSIAYICLGEKTSGGYAVEVNKIIETVDKIEILYSTKGPKPTDFVTTVMTQPYCVIVFSNKENKPITFIIE